LAKLATGVVSCQPTLVGGATLGASAGITRGTSSRPGLGIFAWLATLAAARRGRRLPLLVTLAGIPLLPSEKKLPASGDGARERLWLVGVDNLEATYRLVDRHRGEVQQRFDRASHLLVLLEDAAKELLDSSLLVVVVIAELHQLLQQSVEMESKVINVLTLLEGQALTLLAKCLQC
jgi:hypothetical protein